jgi:hypothetical protein
MLHNQLLSIVSGPTACIFGKSLLLSVYPYICMHPAGDGAHAQYLALKREGSLGPQQAKLRAMFHDAKETVTHPRQAAAQTAARIVGRNWERP